jgi:DNA-binding CsgD family transcriptional regulator
MSTNHFPSVHYGAIVDQQAGAMRRKSGGRQNLFSNPGAAPRPEDLLTPQQRECLLRSAYGNSKKIGRELGISPRTVDTHLRLAISTLGATDRKHAFELLKVWDAPAQEKLRSVALQQGLDKSPRQTARIDNLPTNPTSFVSTHEDGDKVPQNVLRDGASECAAPFGWNAEAPRPRRFLEGVEPDDLKPRHRVLIIIFGAILTMVALASMLAVASVYDKVFLSSSHSN